MTMFAIMDQELRSLNTMGFLNVITLPGGNFQFLTARKASSLSTDHGHGEAMCAELTRPLGSTVNSTNTVPA